MTPADVTRQHDEPHPWWAHLPGARRFLIDERPFTLWEVAVVTASLTPAGLVVGACDVLVFRPARWVRRRFGWLW